MQPEHVEWEETPLLRQTASQLDEYFQGARRMFDVPLSPQGTEFAQTVWKALQTIPHGATRSYGDIARQIGQPSACLLYTSFADAWIRMLIFEMMHVGGRFEVKGAVSLTLLRNLEH